MMLEQNPTDPQEKFNLYAAIVQLYGQEGLVVPRASYIEDAAILASGLGDLDTAKAYGEAAVASWEIVAGSTSREYLSMAEFLKDPTKHSSWSSAI